jgi:outer membrane protein OmpA-like peptidoglycan-associated protein
MTLGSLGAASSLCPADKARLDDITRMDNSEQLKSYEFIARYCPSFASLNRYFLTLSHLGETEQAEKLISALKLQAGTLPKQNQIFYGSLVKHYLEKKDLCKAKEFLAEMEDQWCADQLDLRLVTNPSQCRDVVKSKRLSKATQLFHQTRSTHTLNVNDFMCMLHDLPTRSFIVEASADIKAHFKLGSYRLDGESLVEAKNLSIALQKRKLIDKKKITIIGHADKTGDVNADIRRKNNKQLSRQRAEAIRDFLLSQQGLGSKNFIVIAKGDSDPVINKDTAEAYKANRRVEILID